jgi:hypothetical protein
LRSWSQRASISSATAERYPLGGMIKRFRMIRPFLRGALALCRLVSASTVADAWPDPLFGQALQPRLSIAAGAGIHIGEFGGIPTNGFALSTMAWFRPASFAALRGDVTYAFNIAGMRVCVWDPCPVNGVRHLNGMAVTAMLGNLGAASTRGYALAGTELLLASGRPEWDGRKRTVPKLGAGVLFPSSVFVEVTGRWHSEWQGWRVRHVVFLAGWYR